MRIRLDHLPEFAHQPISELAGALATMDLGTWALGLGGSFSKGTATPDSDIDTRLFHEKEVPWPDPGHPFWADFLALEQAWRDRGFNLDAIGPRTIRDVDAELARYVDGVYAPQELVWSIWGYRVLPDIKNMIVVVDDAGLIDRWKQLIATYPPALKETILARHVPSLRYWRDDYHYVNKVRKGDHVFLSGLASRLVNDLVEVLCAVNEEYFPGDGNNLWFVERLAIKPPGFTARVVEMLYPPAGARGLATQRAQLVDLVDEVLALV